MTMLIFSENEPTPIGAEDVSVKVQVSRHGPLLNSVDDTVAAITSDPISLWWTFNQFPSTSILAAYQFARCRNIDDMRQAAGLIDAPGVNIMYGDKNGNIAWWAAARLVRRPAHVNSKLFLDGASGKDEPMGYYDFRENPQSENPPSGFVYSANNQPQPWSGKLYPGYYAPDHRARRIVALLESDTIWSVDAVKKMGTDSISPALPEMIREILKTIDHKAILTKSPNVEKAYRILEQWDGDHQVDDVRTLPVIIQNDSSLWWDNIHSKDIKETRSMIFTQSFDRALQDLEKQLGRVITEWHWGKVHTLEHRHLFDRKKPLGKIFNVGPFSVRGGNEVIANLAFHLNTDGHYPVLYGPAMRFIVDFSKDGGALGVNPTGQSGFFLSDHYDDQAELFNAGKFRRQMMSQTNITRGNCF
jgi:penicillin amidase